MFGLPVGDWAGEKSSMNYKKYAQKNPKYGMPQQYAGAFELPEGDWTGEKGSMNYKNYTQKNPKYGMPRQYAGASKLVELPEGDWASEKNSMNYKNYAQKNPKYGKVRRQYGGQKNPQRVAAAQKAAFKNPWLRHVAAVRAQNPGISYSEALKLASHSYQKGSGYQQSNIMGGALPSIQATISAKPELSKLNDALNMTGLNKSLSKGKWTIFAPTNAAFANLPANVLNDKNKMTKILLYHMIKGKGIKSSSIPHNKQEFLKTETGENLRINRPDVGYIRINGVADIITSDIQTGNGIIHTIDAVLLP
jgi:uncharacterized surface protein with fasciclin (FAS1) repeats